MACRSSGTPWGGGAESSRSSWPESTSRMSRAQVAKGKSAVSTPLVEKS